MARTRRPVRPTARIGLTAACVLIAFALLGARCGPKAVRVTITSPAHGTFSTAASVLVTGTVTNVPPASAALSVNGVAVTVQPDQTWSTTVGLDANEVFNPVLVDLMHLGNGKQDSDRIVVIAGDSVADGDFSLDSIALRLNDSGLDSVEPAVSDLVDLDIASLLSPGDPVINDFCAIDGGFLGCLGSVDVVIANPPPTTSGFGLDVDSMTNFAAGDVFVTDIVVNANINGSGLAPSCGLRLTADQVNILGDYSLEPDAVDPSNIDVNLLGAPGIAFTAFEDEFTSGLCDFPLIGDLIQLIIGDIQPVVTQGLADFLADPDGSGPVDAPIAEGIEVALAGIQIAGPIGESLGVVLEAPLFDVAEDVDGITLGSDGRVQANFGTGPGQCDPPPGAPDLAASLHVPEPFPTFGPNTPLSGLPYGLGLCISSSAFNQLLKAEIECGLLQSVLTEIDLGLGGGALPITAGLLALIVPEFGNVQPQTLPMRIELRPTLAPVLTGNPGPGGEISELRIGGLEISVVGDGPPAQDAIYLQGQIDFVAGLDFSFDDLTGELVPAIASVQAAGLVVGLTYNPLGADAAFVQFALQQLVPLLLPQLGDTLGAFPLPEFLGLQLQSVAVEQNGEFLSLFVDLVSAP